MNEITLTIQATDEKSAYMVIGLLRDALVKALNDGHINDEDGEGWSFYVDEEV